MKSLFLKLLAGALACLAIASAVGVGRAQNNQPVAAPAPALQPLTSTGASFGDPRANQIVICGACGAEIAAPRAVMIAQPVSDRRRGQDSFYGIPPVGYLPAPAAVYGYGYPQTYYLETFRPGAPEQEFYPAQYRREIYARPLPAAYGAPRQDHRHDTRRGRDRN